MRRLSEALYLIAIVLWVGGLWVVGYLVAPVLFTSLADRALAGQLAGQFFSLIALLGLGCGGYLLVFLLGRFGFFSVRRAVFWLALAMMSMAAAQLFGLQPLMAQLKADALPREVMESVLRDRFSTWHGVSSILYLVQSLLGGWLVVVSGRGLR